MKDIAIITALVLAGFALPGAASTVSSPPTFVSDSQYLEPGDGGGAAVQYDASSDATSKVRSNASAQRCRANDENCE